MLCIGIELACSRMLTMSNYFFWPGVVPGRFTKGSPLKMDMPQLRKYSHEGVGDQFGSPRHHTPIGDAPAFAQFAYRPLK